MYELFNKKNVSNYIFQDEICKGYSVHSAVAISVWEKLLNCLIECFTNELGEIELLDKLPMLIDSKILIDFYGEHFYRIKDRIPSIRYSDGHEKYVATDELPYLVSALKYYDRVFASYTVVRPRNFAVKPFLREEFIRYFQFAISSDENDMDKLIIQIKRAAMQFFVKIRMQVVLVDRQSDSYYSKKSCFHSVWMNGNIESVLQCGLLRKKIDSASEKDKFVIDVGGAQRMLATFIYANSDSQGLLLPYDMRTVDIIIRIGVETTILKAFERIVASFGCRVKRVNGNKKFNEMKKIAVDQGALAVVVQRIVDGKDFLTIYNRDMTKTDVRSISETVEWFEEKYRTIENMSYIKQQQLINAKLDLNGTVLRKGNKVYPVIEEGLFL